MVELNTIEGGSAPPGQAQGSSWQRQTGHLVDAQQEQPQTSGGISFARPSVTTGAALPWRGNKTPTLGPPRAIPSYNSSMPTITVSSSGEGSAQERQASNPDVENAVPLPGPMPLEEAGPDEATNTTQIGTSDVGELESSQSAPKHVSLQSKTSTHSLEPSLPQQPVPVTQIITTSQDAQGGPARNLIKLQSIVPNSGWGYAQSSHMLTVDTSQPNIMTVTTASGAPLSSTAVTTGHTGPSYRYDSDGWLEEGRLSRRRESLRSASKRSGEQAFGLDITDSLDTRASCDYDADAPGLTDDERRRIRRRINNRESARRVREKREADLREVNTKVVELEAEQAKLVKHCAGMEDTCKALFQELHTLRGRWNETLSENKRLATELGYLQRNMMLGSQDEPQQSSGMQQDCVASMPTGAQIAKDLSLECNSYFGRDSDLDWQF